MSKDKDLEASLIPKKEAELDPAKKWLGYVLHSSHVLLLCTQQLLGAVLFNRQPDITTPQLLALRSVFSGFVIFAVMNTRTKSYLFDTVPRDQALTLAMRVAQGMFNMFCTYYVIKYFPLVYVSIVANTAPLLIAFFAYVIYKERLTALDIAVLIISFIGVSVLITGSFEQQDSSELMQTASLVLPVILLVTIPFNQCALQLYLRSMRSLSEYSISAWMTIAMLAVFLPLCVLSKPDHEPLLYFTRDFNIADWCICLAFGASGVFTQTTRARAVHYEESAKLTVLNYFQSVIQLAFDVLFLATPFTTQQILGVAIVIGANSVKWAFTIKRLFFKAPK